MPRFNSGWFKTDRKLAQAIDGFAGGILLKLGSWANVQESTITEGDRIVTIEPGQVWTSTCQIACETGFDRRTVRKRLRLLSKMGAICVEILGEGLIITLHDDLEIQGDVPGHVPCHVLGDVPPDVPGHVPLDDHILKNKEERIEKRYIPPTLDPQDQAIAEAWAEFASSVSRTVKPAIEKWANTVRLLRERDGLTHDDVRSMLDFIKGDDFWRPNAISLEGLRTKSKNGLKKFENIQAAMKKAKPQPKASKDDVPLLTEADFDY